MRIVNPSSVQTVQTAPQSVRGNGPRAAFELPPSAQTKAASGPAATLQTVVSGLETLLAVQTLNADPRDKRRKALRKGAQQLDALDDIKLALVSGEDNPMALIKLRSLTSEALIETGDAGLDGTIAEIDLRAQVELAKRDRMVRRF